MKNDLPENLSAPARRALFTAGITTLARLAKHGEAEIGKLHGMGPKGIEQHTVALREHGLAFAVWEFIGVFASQANHAIKKRHSGIK